MNKTIESYHGQHYNHIGKNTLQSERLYQEACSAKLLEEDGYGDDERRPRGLLRMVH